MVGREAIRQESALDPYFGHGPDLIDARSLDEFV